MALLPTPHQTIGPFFHFALPFRGGDALVDPDDPGAIRVRGRILDGAGEPVIDAMLEVWQADPDGRYAGPWDRHDQRFCGFGRLQTAEDGTYEFVTVKPGMVPGPDGRDQAPHLQLAIFARGILKHLVTRVYFPEDEQALAADAVLGLVDAPLRERLIAVPDDGGYRFDVRLQGECETPFFEV
jgi:protocatechuate 3,4-dioxygenase alpha subunit